MARLGIALSSVCLISTVVIWTVGHLLKDSFRDSGATLTAAMQDERDQSLVSFMTVLYWSVPFSLPVFYDIALQTLGPLPGLKAIGMLAFSVYISALLRIFLGWPQLYWTKHAVRGLACIVDWALPSPNLAPLAAVISYFAWQMREHVGVSLVLPMIYLAVQFFVEIYLGFSDYFTALMSVSLGASLAVCLHGFDSLFEKALVYTIEHKIRGPAWMTSAFVLTIATTFAIYEGRRPELDGNWEDQLDDVCKDADGVSLDAACFTTCVIVAVFFGASTGSIAANVVASDPWWTDDSKRSYKILLTLAYLYLGFGLVFILSIVKQSIRKASDDSFLNFILEDRYGYFTYSYGLITSYILGITLTAILPMFCHIIFSRKRSALAGEEELVNS
jgi:hypothetical protein